MEKKGEAGGVKQKRKEEKNGMEKIRWEKNNKKE